MSNSSLSEIASEKDLFSNKGTKSNNTTRTGLILRKILVANRSFVLENTCRLPMLSEN